jgi:uncharacterized protein YfaS (alpha-2-macroglobulin family)
VRSWSRSDLLTIMELKQLAGLPIDTDSLLRMSLTDALGSRFWSGYGRHRTLWGPHPDLEPTLTAYRIARRAQLPKSMRAGVLQYILASRDAHGWGNTYLNALVLETLSPDSNLMALIQPTQVSLTIDGRKVSLPLDSTLTLAQAPTRMEVTHAGGGLTYISVSQRYWDPDPVPRDTFFKVETSFVDARRGQLQDALKGGDPVTMHVKVKVNAPMEFVMLEIPIPAGCSYAQKRSGYHHIYGAYMESFRDRVCLYFRSMPMREYSFEIPLLPRFGGSYVLNSTRAEQMYMPLLDGYNGIRRVTVR